MSILIADCGASKCSWALLSGEGQVVQHETTGMHAASLSVEDMRQWLGALTGSGIPLDGVDTIYFYGTGCLSESINANVRQALQEKIPGTRRVSVDSDIRGALAAFSPEHPAYIGILGTGTNVGYYDGQQWSPCSRPLGYILGDEGSGADFGKALLRGILREQFNSTITRAFYGKYQLSPTDVIGQLYSSPAPNRLLASYAAFIHAHLEEEQMQDLVRRRFDHFIQAHLIPCPYKNTNLVYLSGGIATSFEALLSECLDRHGYYLMQTLRRPIEGLIKQALINR